MTDKQYAACASVLFLSPIVRHMMKRGDIQMYGDDFCFVQGYIIRGHAIIISTLIGAIIWAIGATTDLGVITLIGNSIIALSIIIVIASLVTIYKNISLVAYVAGEKNARYPSRLITHLFHR